ncbi:MAG: hypothetical protein MK200_08600, partial [Nitrosopumilus sp.]|nr:hypothetical protein [Nitrosopumilus sp.]
MPSLKKVIQTASRGADLYFVFRFLRLLTAKYTATNAYKLGIIDKKGKPLKKSSDLTTSEEKSSYTMLHRLTWKIRGLIEKIPLIGKSILLNYAAALFLLKEQKDPRIWTDEGYMKRKLMEFIETDWEANAQLLKEEVDNMEKKSFQFLRETAVETEASTYRDRTREDEKKKKRHFAFGGKKKEKHGEPGYRTGEEVEVDEVESKYEADIAAYKKKGGKVKKLKPDKPFKSKFSKGYKAKKLPRQAEEVEMDEASKLPPHLAKFFDKDGNLKKDAAARVAKGREKINWIDLTPKGYGRNEEVETTRMSMEAPFVLDKEEVEEARSKEDERELAKAMAAFKKKGGKIKKISPDKAF